ncbi:MAG TPA: aminotransferase class V-fold PLP-dependent enzyme, partial [Acetobacteraceae bacterium]|nr:aminotransferase class V-fold PLP-dependent enzyme [Acetobacteraceae bacterium]
MTLPNRPIYLDNHATTPLDPRVLKVMRPWWEENFSNPASVEHAMGRAAEAAVEEAREQVAALVGAEGREIVLTSGATEANNLAIKGAARFAAGQGDARRRIVTVATEHKCVLESVRDLAAEGFEPVILPVRPDGLLEQEALRDALRTPTLLVSVMAVNNEIGVIQDLAAIGAIAKEAGALFHTDAAQAAGRIALNVEEIRADLLSLSGHKVYGPKGIGALYVRRRPRVRLAPLFSGGGQERGLRSGTLPAPLVIGFGEACRIAAAEGLLDAGRIAGQRDLLLGALSARVPGLVVNGHAERRVSGNLN